MENAEKQTDKSLACQSLMSNSIWKPRGWFH